jgi:hypothetical protein
MNSGGLPRRPMQLLGVAASPARSRSGLAMAMTSSWYVSSRSMTGFQLADSANGP